MNRRAASTGIGQRVLDKMRRIPKSSKSRKPKKPTIEQSRRTLANREAARDRKWTMTGVYR